MTTRNARRNAHLQVQLSPALCAACHIPTLLLLPHVLLLLFGVILPLLLIIRMLAMAAWYVSTLWAGEEAGRLSGRVPQSLQHHGELM